MLLFGGVGTGAGIFTCSCRGGCIVIGGCLNGCSWSFGLRGAPGGTTTKRLRAVTRVRGSAERRKEGDRDALDFSFFCLGGFLGVFFQTAVGRVCGMTMYVLLLDPLGVHWGQTVRIADQLIRAGHLIMAETSPHGFDPQGFDHLVLLGWDRYGAQALERCLVEDRGLVVIGNGPLSLAPVWADRVRVLPRDVEPGRVLQTLICLDDTLFTGEIEEVEE